MNVTSVPSHVGATASSRVVSGGARPLQLERDGGCLSKMFEIVLTEKEKTLSNASGQKVPLGLIFLELLGNVESLSLLTR